MRIVHDHGEVLALFDEIESPADALQACKALGDRTGRRAEHGGGHRRAQRVGDIETPGESDLQRQVQRPPRDGALQPEAGPAGARLHLERAHAGLCVERVGHAGHVT